MTTIEQHNGTLIPSQIILFSVQVMALIAYLMEFKGNYGPHLIIVPNAVLVNWKVSFFLLRIVRMIFLALFLSVAHLEDDFSGTIESH